jgi:hypothetical protein
MISAQHTHNLEVSNQVQNVEQLLRENYPGRNEKYYNILLLSKEKFTDESYRLELTAEAIITSCNTARPTWYSYFRNVEQYYQDVLFALSETMTSHAFLYLQETATDQNWISILKRLKMFVFLSNTKIITSYFPSLRSLWSNTYEKLIRGYAEILGPILNLSPGRVHLFIKNIANEMIIHSEKYSSNPFLYEQFIRAEYALFMAEQNK